MAELLPIAVAGPVVLACVLLMLGGVAPRGLVDALAVLVALAQVGVLVVLLRAGRVVAYLAGWRVRAGAGVGIVLVGDRAGVAFALVAAVLCAVALAYGWRYFTDIHAHYHAMMLLFLAGMTGYALSGDLFDMFVFFELMGAAAYALTGFKVEEPESVQGGFNFAVVNSCAAFLTLFGIGLLYTRTGRLGLAQLGTALGGHAGDALVGVAFVLVCAGWLVKAAAVPFHFWLADAHAVAPAPVCVLLSGAMAPLGLYGMWRTTSAVFAGALDADAVRAVLACFGVASMVIGVVMCVLQRHIKRMLAYSTVAHLGVVLAALPTAPGAALTYLFGHAVIKGALFLVAGVLLSRFGDVDEIDLYGRVTRALAVPLVVGGLALAGLPPFGLGLGKQLLDEHEPMWFVVALFAVSALTGAAVLRVALRVCFGAGPRPGDTGETERTTGGGEQPEGRERLRTVPTPMVLAIAVLLALGVAGGVFGGWLGRGFGVSAGAALSDHGGYLAAVEAMRSAAEPLVSPEWTVAGMWGGLASAALACVLASIGLRFVPGGRVVHGLHRVHSGHVGDYLAWLVFGVTVFGASVLVPSMVR